MSATWPTVRIADLPFAAVTESQAVEHIVRAARSGRGGWLVTPNLDIVRQCVASPATAAMARQADLLVADGAPILWAGRVQGTPLPGRVAGSNLVEAISAQSAVHGLRVFLLGGDDGIAERARAGLQSRYPGLQVVGTYCPPVGFEKMAQQLEAMAKLVAQAKPDIVYVALGFPKQEHLIRDLRHAAPNAWWLGIGISLSFSGGALERAPLWMQRSGLEWVHRMAQDPKRLSKRYLVHGIPFAFRLLGTALRARKQQSH